MCVVISKPRHIYTSEYSQWESLYWAWNAPHMYFKHGAEENIQVYRTPRIEPLLSNHPSRRLHSVHSVLPRKNNINSAFHMNT